jgi:hypothetical protein
MHHTISIKKHRTTKIQFRHLRPDDCRGNSKLGAYAYAYSSAYADNDDEDDDDGGGGGAMQPTPAPCSKKTDGRRELTTIMLLMRSAATLCCRAHKCASNLLVRRPDVGGTFEPRKPKSVSHVVGSCCFCMGMNLLHRPHCPRSKAKQASTTQSKASTLLGLTHARTFQFQFLQSCPVKPPLRTRRPAAVKRIWTFVASS